MRIAVIMLCHKNLEQINSLIQALEDEDFFFYVHVDKKSNVDRKKICGKNVYILPKDESIAIQWGGFGMIEATLRLIERARSGENDFDYIWLMSGQDYPLWPVDEIVEFMEKHKGEDFIEILPNEIAFNRGYFKRNELYYPTWMVSNKTYIKIIKHLLWAVTGGKKSTKICTRRTVINHFYYGSQWWVLSKHSLEIIMEFLNKNSWYKNFFKNSLVPDESFFQTLYGMLIGMEKAKPSVCYVNWKENRNSPEVFTCNDKDRLIEMKNKFLIARKFDFKIDNSIQNLLIALRKGGCRGNGGII